MSKLKKHAVEVINLTKTTIKSFDSIDVGKTLLLIDGTKLQPFEAVDNDAGIFGDIDFEISSNNNDKENFEMFKLNKKHSELRSKTDRIEEKTYFVSLFLCDDTQ